jgi:diguanylate cyclase (GGDEF)-like protein
MIGALGVNRDITARIEETERLARLAHYDTLTQIPNRYLVLDRVERLIAQSERDYRKSRFALVFIDVDKFKTINDNKGHLFGDLVLIETAKRLKQSIRNSDTAARLGGDEFLILLGEITTRKDVSTKVSSLVSALGEQFIIDGEAFDVSYSVGSAIYPTADALLKLADNAMYQSKQQKNSY